MTFQPDYPGAIVVEAMQYGYGVLNRPKRWGFHTPEEPADSYPSTPDYLAITNRDASYNYFVSYLGFVFQLVPESEGAYAHGLDGKPAPLWSDGTNLNLQSLSLSFEGYAGTIHLTMPRGSPQWNAGVELVAHRTKALGLDLDSSFQHKDVSIYRGDCGQWDQAAFIADVKTKIKSIGEDEMLTQEDKDWLWKEMERRLRHTDARFVALDAKIGALEGGTGATPAQIAKAVNDDNARRMAS